MASSCNPKGLAAEAAALRAAGKLKEAEQAYRRLLATDAGPAAFNELCLVLSDLGRNEEALDALEQALARYPDHLQLIAQRGVMLERLRRYAQAIDVYEQVLLRDGNLVPILNNLAGLRNRQGRHDEAVDLFRRALAMESNPATHSNLLFAMNYSDRFDQRALFAERKRWAAQNLPTFSGIEPFTNVRDPDRRLRVGYVSADFKMHPVAFFIGAVIAKHDRNAIEVFCYSATFASDEMPDTLRRMNVVWRDIAALDDASAAQLIRNDGIDIAVDLSGHTAGNRLLTLARRPAPIQASYLGYPNTTGMQAIDYRFTDAWADPPGASDATHSETLIRLPGGFLAYTPPANMPPVRELPARIAGHITFGSFSNLAKISRETIALWSRALAQVPDARLIIKSYLFAEAATRERFCRRFVENGVSSDRLLLLSEPRRSVEHYDTLNRIDIALDTVPYNGTTTTCEALWMGVPVVALAGDRHASRVGASILNAAGLPELIARTPDAYVAIARALASDLGRLATLRASLRACLAGSPLLDTQRLTRALEASYRTLWRDWCANADARPDDGEPTGDKQSRINRGELGSGASSPDLIYDDALGHYNAGRFDQAAAGVTEALSHHPRHVSSLCLLGAIEIQNGHYQSATDILRRAISLNPNVVTAHSNLGVALRALGKLAEAVTSFEQAVALKPDFADAHVNLGIAFKDKGQLDSAIECYRRAIKLEPDNAKAYSNLGVALADQGHLDAAIEAYHRALALKPGYAEAHNNLGAAFDRLARLTQAEESFRSAISNKPDYAQAHCNLGLTLKKMDRLIEAEESFRRALAINPAQAQTHQVLGIVQKLLGRLDEGMESYRRAVALKPDFADAHFSLANAQLALGDFENGWRGYEWRLRTDWYGPRSFTQPLWRGEDLTGKTILLYPEQGLGDVIHFLRYAPLVAVRSGLVIVEVPLALAPLAATLKGRGQVIASGDPSPAFDFYCSLLSLPERFATTAATIPAGVPYLSADPALVEKWREDFASDAGLKIGLAWAGNPKQENDRYRSIGLETLRPLLDVSGIRWVSLQVGERAADVARLPPGTIADLSDRLTDFAQTAAVIANLHLVITIDSAVAHLAGALGRPVWTLVSAVADWRYPLKGERSAWYPTMRVFRQAALGDWNGVLSQVQAELAKLARQHVQRSSLQGGDQGRAV